MNKIISYVAFTLLATSSVVSAESDDSLLPDWDATATATLASDYVWRGVSQTENRPAIQGSVDVSHESGFYAGIWASNIESFDASGHSIEIDLYTGFAGETDFGGALPLGLGWDVGWLRYEFPSNSSADLNEIYAGLSLSPLEWLSLSYYYYYGTSVEQRNAGNYQDASVDISLPWDVGLGLHVGQYDQRGGLADYVDWKVSMTKSLGGFNFEVAWTDTDQGSADNDSIADDHFVVSVSRTLGDPAPSESLPAGFDASATATLATDYIYRGISQTGNDPAVQGSFDISHESGLYAGVWASNVDLDGAGGDNNVELDIYAGIAGEAMGIGWDFGWLRYEYPGARGLNFNELYAGLSYSPLDMVDLGFTYYYGLKIEHQHPGQYYDASVDIRPLSGLSDSSPVTAFLADLNLGMHYGYYNLNRTFTGITKDPDYSDWKIGVSKDIGAFNFEVAYTDTDSNSALVTGSPGASGTDDGRALFTVSTDL